ncbi:MAG: ubiquinol-cytochrome c reductase iron-sulfur subunit [Rhodocyclales bacterium]|nr:ubiquinol-cytochrome c reductase iron-sulfur subunit [Rhodocyclales bacterium]
MDPTRRQLLVATSAAGALAGIGVAIPLVSSLMPSERAKAAGAPVEADISRLAPGEMMTVEWRGKPVWIIHRTQEMLASLKQAEPNLVDPDSKEPQQPEYASNEFRSRKPEYMVAIGICTHLGCSPTEKFRHGDAQGMPADWPGGFFCPCHGSQFDLAGRVYKNMPAPSNLEIPPHQYLAEGRLLIGEDGTAA